MSGAGRQHDANDNGQVLHWSGRVFAASDIRQLNGCGAVLLAKETILTPLAAEELRERGVEVRRGEATTPASSGANWGLAQERSYPVVGTAAQSLERDGLQFWTMPACESGRDCDWARQLAECVTHGDCLGGIVFCSDPGLVCCVANKHTGLRAVAVGTSQGAARAALSVGPNLIAVEMPGKTFFEIRQLLRAVSSGDCSCPPAMARMLADLEGHAKTKGDCKCASVK